jgi:hypothetical protein
MGYLSQNNIYSPSMLLFDLCKAIRVPCMRIEFLSFQWENVHYILHNFALEIPLQYFGASLENAEFLAPLFFFSTSGAELLVGKV